MLDLLKGQPLVISMQHFAEPGDPDPANPPAPPAPPAPTTPPAPADGKTFSDVYVGTLKDEIITNRQGRKAAEAMLRKVLGLADDEKVTDDKIEAFQKANTDSVAAALAKANDRLIKAEIKGLEGYDAKLVERLVDRSKITVDDEGNVTGIKEAVEALEKEFPQIKITAGGGAGGANPPPNTKTEVEQLEEKLAKATTTQERIAIQLRIAALKKG